MIIDGVFVNLVIFNLFPNRWRWVFKSVFSETRIQKYNRLNIKLWIFNMFLLSWTCHYLINSNVPSGLVLICLWCTRLTRELYRDKTSSIRVRFDRGKLFKPAQSSQNIRCFMMFYDFFPPSTPYFIFLFTRSKYAKHLQLQVS